MNTKLGLREEHATYITALSEKTAYIFEELDSEIGIKANESLSNELSNKIRMERSLSWLRRDAEMLVEDLGVSFILHWISFEALFSHDEDVKTTHKSDKGSPARYRIKSFISEIVETVIENKQERLHDILKKDEVWKSVGELMNNPFIDPANWHKYYGGTTKAGPKTNPFSTKGKVYKKNQLNDPKQFPQIMEGLFERLYYVRNSIFHGNATHKGKASDSKRSGQVKAGTVCLRNIVPGLIHIMLDDLEKDTDDAKWGLVPYPRIRGD